MSGESYCPECSAVFTGLPHACTKAGVGLTGEEIDEQRREWLSHPLPRKFENLIKASAEAQLKKVFELVDKIYDEPDEHLALAYLHKTLLEEVK